MAKLSTSQRSALPKSSFAIPGKAPKSGSYPINDPNHAKNALARSSGKPIANRVRAAVKAKFPGMIGKGKAQGPVLNNKVQKNVNNIKERLHKKSVSKTQIGF